MNVPSGLGGPEPGPAGHMRQSDRSGFALYIQVRDIAESLGRVPDLGGTVVSQPFDVPGWADDRRDRGPGGQFPRAGAAVVVTVDRRRSADAAEAFDGELSVEQRHELGAESGRVECLRSRVRCLGDRPDREDEPRPSS